MTPGVQVGAYGDVVHRLADAADPSTRNATDHRRAAAEKEISSNPSRLGTAFLFIHLFLSSPHFPLSFRLLTRKDRQANPCWHTSTWQKAAESHPRLRAVSSCLVCLGGALHHEHCCTAAVVFPPKKFTCTWPVLKRSFFPQNSDDPEGMFGAFVHSGAFLLLFCAF